jgi:AhpD family alkylhydroperoxidase
MLSRIKHRRKPMPHIALPEGLPGITGPFALRPETAKLMRELAEIPSRGPNTLSSGEREIIATFTSSRNDCHFCQTSHGAAAAHHLGEASELAGNLALIAGIKRDFESGPYRRSSRHC